MSRLIRWFIAAAIFLAVIVWVEIELSWRSVLLAWSNVSAVSLIGLTIVTFLSYFLRAYRVYFYFDRDNNHSLLLYCRISLFHNAWNNFLPMRLGEASFPIMMKQAFDCSIVKSSAGLLWIRLMDLHWLLVLLFSIGAIQLNVFFVFAIIGLIVAPLVAWRYIGFISIEWSLMQKIMNTLSKNSPGSFVIALKLYILTAIIWIAKLSALTVIMLSFIDLPSLEGVFAVIFADLSSVLPIHGLAGSGTYEAAMLAALLPLGAEYEAVLTAAINVHIYILVTTLLAVPLAILLPRRTTNKQN